MSDSLEWRISDDPVPYPDAIAEMEQRVEAIRRNQAPELVWLLDHPPIYTAGVGAQDNELLDPNRFPVYRAGRGGRYTYHGPGQRVAYVLLDLKRRDGDIRMHVRRLEEWLILTLAQFGVKGERRTDRIGVWVNLGAHGRPGQEAKIGALGVRVRHWVTFHGVALNVDPDLGHFSGIVPCGIGNFGVTSLHDLGHLVNMPEVDSALIATWPQAFGTGSPSCRLSPEI
ncbi:Octanoyltransferase [Azospirillaceae bacterium]